ncbi:gamma-secretase subunit PEN-2-like [Mercenaria mercenaria]|uniref:gamma-secretase subunit PEN-2-like n=1 Tax=Mercenaria mercenaria TaxID=6596 RepID=UPI001E1DF56D|nr:gamma-secretase subunit PEN-2-like [Mercenaria mercenaria]XP_045209964.1 gamma-secretase subunit PEN-2-like [Mercenaria mercenaria]XP_045209965.1 gamma-secretase subunit PEN-2-like [Mercenaria mercenaria]
MDLRRVKNEDKLELCRKYYLGGFAMLPFLWFVNSVWFFKEAFFKAQYEQQKQIRTYVIRSIIGSVIWIAIIVTWVTIFQLKRAEWGAAADYMSFIIPRGEP